MKKRLFALLAAVCVLITLGGCNKSSKRPFDYDLSKYITLGDYIGIEYTYSVAEVTDEAVTSLINSELSSNGYGETVEVTDRGIINGDTANIDFVGKLNGEAFEGGSDEGYNLVIGSNSFIEGFEDGLIGVKPGETVDLDLTFPENYDNEELKGQAVVFTVKVNSVTTVKYPELTEDIVAEISDYTTIDEYMKYANDTVATNNEKDAVDQKETDIWTAIVNNVEVKSLPEDEIANYKELLIESYDSIASQQYGMTYEEFLDTYMGKTLEDVDADLTTQAESAVKEYMTIVAIARDQDLDIDDEEYNEQVEKYAASNGYSDSADFLKAVDEGQFYLSLLVEKVIDFVVENAVQVA